MEQRVEELSAALKAIQEQNTAILKAVEASTTIFSEIQPVVVDLAAWRPTLEQSIADLRHDLEGVRKEIDTVARNLVLALKPSDFPPILPKPSSAPFPYSGSSAPGPDARPIDPIHRGGGSWVITTLIPPPITGRSSGNIQTTRTKENRWWFREPLPSPRSHAPACTTRVTSSQQQHNS
ncbi:uncharacterized protein LOC123425540 [Hordeum vulgare subsp. vulgare]|uniref:uncharacterized protein LOC123425540 n=1 Tax=Hordeum vulgare subsp. vulgare TaxID=112509 RepID=UPI00162D5666|nr:uncharacterized protein LOC123425540 [Hordeum vulgare subsp. vulgare]KAI5012359.1 hypothetical protein ZWY2020_024493 [Hordeum vulgare]